MSLIGNRDSRDLVVYTGVDATVLKQFELRDNTTFDVVVGRLRGALTALNAEAANDPLMDYAFVTDSPEVSYRMGAGAAFKRATEYATADMNRAESEGHMLPIAAYDLGLGWTWEYLRKSKSNDIDGDIQLVLNAARDAWRVGLLTRLFKRGDDSGASNGLGAAGLSPGLATAAANTGVDFAPFTYGGVSFDTSHEHYKFAATLTSANIVTLMKTVREHGHKAPYDLLVSETDLATITGFSDFVAAGDPFVQYASTSSIASAALGEGFVGYLKDSLARVRMQTGVPANYVALLKSYGKNNRLNPLRIRVDQGETALRVQAFPDPSVGGISPVNPLGSLSAWTEFGVGVGDRTAGAVWRNNAAWADGAVS